MAQFQSNNTGVGGPAPYGMPSTTASQAPYGAQQSNIMGQGAAQPRPFYGEQHNQSVPEPQFMQMQPMGQVPQQAQPYGQQPQMGQAAHHNAAASNNLMGSIGGSSSGGSDLDLGAAAPFAQMGMNYVGTKMGWIRYFTTAGLKYYFHVNNNYVKNKLKILLCPLLHKKWKRDGQPDAQQQIVYRPPSDDVNAPDLYLPLMAIITYILLMGVLLGVYHNFTPEYLGLTASSAMVVIVLEILLIRVGFHVLGFSNPPSLLDILAYCSYKFVGLPVALIIGIFAGSSALYMSVLVLAALNAIFMMRTMGGVMKPLGQQIMQVQQPGSKNTFLLLIGVLQLISNYILIHNAIPSTPDSPALETLSTNEMA